MARVAILHYTLSPAVGGIESLIEEQCAALQQLGHDVRLIAGSGNAAPGTTVHIVERMAPTHDDCLLANVALRDGNPDPALGLATSLEGQLDAALDTCDMCWVHNILTVGLHPALTWAVERLARRRTEIRWTAWCEDLSATSGYWDGSPGSPPALTGMRYVTISPSRARELAEALRLPLHRIQIISPPIDVLAYSHVADQTRMIVGKTELFDAFPTVLVPAKLLPHKRIEVSVRAIAHLARNGHDSRLLVTGAPSPHEPSVSADVAKAIRELTSSLGIIDNVYLLTDVLGETPEHATIRDLMLLCDAVFLPSAEEGFGLPLREAAALRAPVICADLPAFRDAAPNARFVSLDTGDDEVATALLEVAALPTNVARREAVRSRGVFRAQVASLMEAGIRE